MPYRFNLSATCDRVHRLLLRQFPHTLLSPTQSPLKFCVLHDKLPGEAASIRDLSDPQQVEVVFFYLDAEEDVTEDQVFMGMAGGVAFYGKKVKEFKRLMKMKEGPMLPAAEVKGNVRCLVEATILMLDKSPLDECDDCPTRELCHDFGCADELQSTDDDDEMPF